MAVLSADVQIPSLGSTAVKLGIPAGVADTYYAGAILYADAAFGLVQAVPVAGDSFIGICAKNVVISSADVTAGVLVDVFVDGIFLIPFTAAAADDAGDTVWSDVSAGSDNPADLLPNADAGTKAASEILIGKCLAISGSSGWVKLHAIQGLLTIDATSLDEAYV